MVTIAIAIIRAEDDLNDSPLLNVVLEMFTEKNRHALCACNRAITFLNTNETNE